MLCGEGRRMGTGGKDRSAKIEWQSRLGQMANSTPITNDLMDSAYMIDCRCGPIFSCFLHYFPIVYEGHCLLTFVHFRTSRVAKCHNLGKHQYKSLIFP